MDEDVAVGGATVYGVVEPPLPLGPATGEAEEPAGVGAAIGAPSVRRPGRAVRVAAYPLVVLSLRNAQVSANVGLIADDFVVDAAGEVTVEAWTEATGVKVLVTVDGDATGQYAAINGGAAIAQSAWYRETLEVVPGDRLNIQLSTATAVTLRVLYREGT